MAALVSCGSGALQADGGGTCTGAGGIGGSAGTSAGAAGGQGGAAKVGSWRQLSCITALLSECPVEGSCSKQLLDGGNDSRTTFASGVTVSFQGTRACDSTTDAVWTFEVRRSDGSLCFSKQGVIQHNYACERGQLTVRDGNGDIVATGALTAGGSTLACTSSAETCGGTGGFGGADCDVPLDVDCATGACR